MAQIDATGMVTDFDVLGPYSIDHNQFVAGTPDSYQWQTTNGYYVTALSALGDITSPPAALGGTVNAVNIVDSTYNPSINITGLNLSLTSILDTGNAANMHEKFWEAVLDGDTTILTPTTSGHVFTLMGDFVRVNTGQDVTGGNDSFTGNKVQNSGLLTGDAILVDGGSILHGGDDVFNGAVVGDAIIGDVGDGNGLTPTNLGTVDGGNDTVTIVDPNYSPQIILGNVIGDVDFNGFDGTVNGGDDHLTLRNFSIVTNVVGDNYRTEGIDNGGNDTILVATTIAGRTFANAANVFGDDNLVDGSGGTFTATGGNDSITMNNVGGSNVEGDFFSVNEATGFGGNDTIAINGTFPLTTPPPPYPITPAVGDVNGDAYSVTGTHAFTGGDDSIGLSNVGNSNTTGDAYTVGSLPSFTGGNDTIAYNYDRTDTAAPFFAQGDAYVAISAIFIGGNDAIAANLAASLQPSSTGLIGDVYTYGFNGDGEFHGGNDILIANTAAIQTASLFGDAQALSSVNYLAAYGGNDALTGGAGNDTLYGDWQSAIAGNAVTAEVGGNDTLDGRGGNDWLYGGDGNDTVLFSLKQSVYVDLKGIPGSGAPGFLYEAIGQGNDQLDSIENVIGSSRADVIFGDDSANRLNGSSGADQISGRGGNDTLIGGAGGDFLNGGAGTDRAQYIDAAAGLTADLQVIAGNTGFAAGDSYASIEDLYGSNFNDNLRGNGGANHIWGADGNDVIFGRNGADSLYGLNGNDTLVGGAGGDLLNGGAGTDRAQYNDATSGLTVDLQVAANNTGIAAGDSYVSVENLYGSNYNDNLRGDAGSNDIWGANGDDSIYGRDGEDTLFGGSGNDSLYGQTGRDFLYGNAGGDTFMYLRRRTPLPVLSGTRSGTSAWVPT